MGLAMAQQVVNDHAGNITIEDACKGGCRITVELPLLKN
jgi:nitrogen fixation/metabolism regulation signal transduction histidine kinase